ncbi:MAG: hypothetical protein FWH48_08275, partial [Oscillospiraceae bacterium]|nr:hypothetical protein [Oscillospiraceae bacterium]
MNSSKRETKMKFSKTRIVAAALLLLALAWLSACESEEPGEPAKTGEPSEFAETAESGAEADGEAKEVRFSGFTQEILDEHWTTIDYYGRMYPDQYAGEITLSIDGDGALSTSKCAKIVGVDMVDPYGDYTVTALVKAFDGAGISINVDENGEGYNFMFTDYGLEFLNDGYIYWAGFGFGPKCEYSYVPGEWHWMKFEQSRIDGEIRGKAWREGEPEPEEWTYAAELAVFAGGGMRHGQPGLYVHPAGINTKFKEVKVEMKETKNTQRQYPDFMSLSDPEYRAMVEKLAGDVRPAPLADYFISPGGGLAYDPLSREAKKIGTLNKYDGKPRQSGSIEVGGIRLDYSIPTEVTAYDMIPIEYSLSVPDGAKYPIHVGATSFEQEDRRKGRELFDLNLPGAVSLDLEYLGHVSGTLDHYSTRNHMTPEADEPEAAKYPDYETVPLRRSGVVEVADLTWFKFCYTNDGDTILDPEGQGAYQIIPKLYKYGEGGEREYIGQPVNMWHRSENYLYPGESEEVWFNFGRGPEKPEMPCGMQEPGEYCIEIQLTARYAKNTVPDWGSTIWTGYEHVVARFDFLVKEQPEDIEPNPVTVKTTLRPAYNNINRWLSVYEEFMSSYVT